MKSLRELRKDYSLEGLEVTSCVSRLNYLNKQKIDFDVYLPTYGMYLQRDYVWNDEQKGELIVSILLGRSVPDLSLLNIIDSENKHDEIIQVIDGKQRLKTMLDFLNDKFKVELFGNLYLFSELPEDYRNVIEHYNVRYKVAYDNFDRPISDDVKVKWFKLLNYSGTPMDKLHIEKFIK